jgi:hypothetical protein
MINTIFKIVANSLKVTAKLTGFTYNQLNILLYYFVIPFTWFLMLDAVFNWHYLSIGFIVFSSGFFVGCRNFKSYADWAFHKSVNFLNYFNKFGSNYYASSVWICVSIPIVIYAILICLLFNH